VRRAWRRALWGALLGSRAVPPATAAPLIPDPAQQQAVAAYVIDPHANRTRLLALGRGRTKTLPPMVLLVVADAAVRSGRIRRARGLLAEVVARDETAVSVGWAEHGLGWTALVAGDLEVARTHYARVAAIEWKPMLGAVGVGLADAVAGAGADSAVGLDAVAERGDASPTLRGLARLTAAYAFYWRGEYGAAASRFAAVASEYADTSLADDGRYGAAVSRLRAGERATARRELVDLGARAPAGTAFRATRALLLRAARSVLRSGHRAYVGGPTVGPEQQLAALVDLDGALLAKLALRFVDAGEDRTVVATSREIPRPSGVLSTPRTEAGEPPSAARLVAATPTRATERERPSQRRVAIGCAILGVVSLLAILLRSLRVTMAEFVAACRRDGAPAAAVSAAVAHLRRWETHAVAA
jgi:hypothetical protein